MAVLPRSAFERPSGELSARLSYVNFDGTKALAASETIPLHLELPEKFIMQYCTNTIEGVQRISNWVMKK
ncbi:MAG: hypothetical protein E4G94_11325 [ANME-2 cluster archaeon]|nr:MAG: hypothetical protein E4G94_11325 [ANME-2 cluster archaeon]